MIAVLAESIIETKSVTAPSKSPAVNVATLGGDSLAFVMVATSASTPGTASITLEGSLDNTSYIAIGSAVTVSANGVYALTLDRPPMRYYRVSYAIASGSYTSTLRVLVRGDKIG